MSLNGYKLKRELGQGSHAPVYLAVEEAVPSRKVAIKQIQYCMFCKYGLQVLSNAMRAKM